VLSIRASSRLPPKYALVQAEFLRAYFPYTNFRQHQTLWAPSSDAYNLWVKEKGYPHASEDICSEDGMETRLLWIGEPWRKGDTDKKVLLYFHGGGYIIPLYRGQLELCRFLREQLASYGENISVACLEYCMPLGL
jgi:acetyl esterase/lipase